MNNNDKTQLNPDSLAQGFTQSELVLMDACQEKWYRQYNQMLRQRGTFEWWSVYGTAVHTSLQSYYAYGDGRYELATLQIPEDVILTAADESKLIYYRELLRIQIERYARFWIEDFTDFKIVRNEEIIKVHHEGIDFSGKLDLVIEDTEQRTGPMDHKTSAMFTPEIFAGWNFRFQFLFYAWLWWKHSGELPNTIWWNGIRKPQLRQKQNEPQESLMVRIEQAMVQVPEDYLKRQMLPIDDPLAYLKHFEKRILGPKLSRLRLLTEPTTSGIIIESLARNMNTSNCVRFGKPCEFIKLCEHGWKAEGMSFVQRENKHEELEELE